MASSSHIFPSTEELLHELKRILVDAGFVESDLVAVQPAPFSGHARYVLSVKAGRARFALADALKAILHRPLIGGLWVLCLDDVEAILAVAPIRQR
jgi:hypothetical protein